MLFTYHLASIYSQRPLYGNHFGVWGLGFPESTPFLRVSLIRKTLAAVLWRQCFPGKLTVWTGLTMLGTSWETVPLLQLTHGSWVADLGSLEWSLRRDHPPQSLNMTSPWLVLSKDLIPGVGREDMVKCPSPKATWISGAPHEDFSFSPLICPPPFLRPSSWGRLEFSLSETVIYCFPRICHSFWGRLWHWLSRNQLTKSARLTLLFKSSFLKFCFICTCF